MCSSLFKDLEDALYYGAEFPASDRMVPAACYPYGCLNLESSVIANAGVNPCVGCAIRQPHYQEMCQRGTNYPFESFESIEVISMPDSVASESKRSGSVVEEGSHPVRAQSLAVDHSPAPTSLTARTRKRCWE